METTTLLFWLWEHKALNTWQGGYYHSRSEARTSDEQREYLVATSLESSPSTWVPSLWWFQLSGIAEFADWSPQAVKGVVVESSVSPLSCSPLFARDCHPIGGQGFRSCVFRLHQWFANLQEWRCFQCFLQKSSRMHMECPVLADLLASYGSLRYVFAHLENGSHQPVIWTWWKQSVSF